MTPNTPPVLVLRRWLQEGRWTRGVLSLLCTQHRTERNWISVVVIYNITTTELWFYKRGSSAASAREAAPLLHCCCTPPTRYPFHIAALL